jgi:hypothetical protein
MEQELSKCALVQCRGTDWQRSQKMSHGAEALLRADAGVRVQRFAVHKIESIEPAKTVTSLFTLLSVLWCVNFLSSYCRFFF